MLYDRECSISRTGLNSIINAFVEDAAEKRRSIIWPWVLNAGQRE
jgi:hypothetical protein